MILRAKPEGSILILELEGHLDFETTLQFEDTFNSLVEKNHASGVVFNLQKLKFVGSSGINQFVKVLKDFNNGEVKPKFCFVSSEFSKIFRAYQTTRNPFDIFEDEGQARAAAALPPVPRKPARAKKVPAKKKPIEN
jgi:anti-anti-sigma factor